MLGLTILPGGMVQLHPLRQALLHHLGPARFRAYQRPEHESMDLASFLQCLAARKNPPEMYAQMCMAVAEKLEG